TQPNLIFLNKNEFRQSADRYRERLALDNTCTRKSVQNRARQPQVQSIKLHFKVLAPPPALLVRDNCHRAFDRVCRKVVQFEKGHDSLHLSTLAKYFLFNSSLPQTRTTSFW